MQSRHRETGCEHASHTREDAFHAVSLIVDDVGFARDRKTPVIVDKLHAQNVVQIIEVRSEERVGRLQRRRVQNASRRGNQTPPDEDKVFLHRWAAIDATGDLWAWVISYSLRPREERNSFTSYILAYRSVASPAEESFQYVLTQRVRVSVERLEKVSDLRHEERAMR